MGLNQSCPLTEGAGARRLFHRYRPGDGVSAPGAGAKRRLRAQAQGAAKAT